MSTQVRPERAGDQAAVDALVAQAFGPGRFAKSAYRLREGVPPLADLGYVLELDGVVAGTVRYWPIAVGTAPGIMLGPIAVRADLQGQGHALQLMQTSLARARELGYRFVLLVGDEAYYARAGFAAIKPVGRITMPGPVDLSRVLGLELEAGALAALAGEVCKTGVDTPLHAAGARLAPLATPAGHQAAENAD
jgi:predicted N-acetyltransferase YhbS